MAKMVYENDLYRIYQIENENVEEVVEFVKYVVELAKK